MGERSEDKSLENTSTADGKGSPHTSEPQDQHSFHMLFDTDGVRRKIANCYSDALKKRMLNPAIFVLDLRDQTAQQIALHSLYSSEIELFLKGSEKLGGLPLITIYVPPEVAAKWIDEIGSSVATRLSESLSAAHHSYVIFASRGVVDFSIYNPES